MSSSEIIDEIVRSQIEFVGEKSAFSAARKAPLEISPEGDVMDFYGEEDVVVEILLKQFYHQTGAAGIRYTRTYLERKDLNIPDEVQMPSENDFFGDLMDKIRDIIPV